MKRSRRRNAVRRGKRHFRPPPGKRSVSRQILPRGPRGGRIKSSPTVVGQLSARRERDGTMVVARRLSHGLPPALEPAEPAPQTPLLETRAIRTDTVISFQVHGLPIPQGSTRAWV